MTGMRMRLVVCAVLAIVAVSMLRPSSATGPRSSELSDPDGDAAFPNNRYGVGPNDAPGYLDVVHASVTLVDGVFTLEVTMGATIPDVPDLAGVSRRTCNHLGPTFAFQTDSASAWRLHVTGNDNRFINTLAGVIYTVDGAGLGLGTGWIGFFFDLDFNVHPLPFTFSGKTFTITLDATWLGNPSAFSWGLGTECDPVHVADERGSGTLLLADMAPDRGWASWPS